MRIVKRITDPDWKRPKIAREFFGHNKADRKRLRACRGTAPRKRARSRRSAPPSPEAEDGDDPRCYRSILGGFDWDNSVGQRLGDAHLVKTWCAVGKVVTYHPPPWWDFDVTFLGEAGGYKIDGFDHLVHRYAAPGEGKYQLGCHVSAETIRVMSCFLWYFCSTAFVEREGVLGRWTGKMLDVDARY